MFLSRLHYIHNNPVKEGYVENAVDYLYSSARDYNNGKGLVQVAVL
jgi:putative transposase